MDFSDDDDIVLFFDLNHEVPRQFHVQIHTEQIDVYKQQTNKQTNGNNGQTIHGHYIYQK